MYLLKNWKYIAIVLLAISLSNCTQKQENKQNSKYVFLFIGDGMGEAQVALTEAYLKSLQDSIGFEKLSMSEFPIMGLAKTYAANRLITGSAASGTALATGYKTSINTISMDSTRRDSLLSIAYFAKKANKKVGVLSSVGINHATPAVFYAHQALRNQYYEIAMQLPHYQFDVFGGGGIIEPKGKDNQKKNIETIIQNKGYRITHSLQDFQKITASQNKILMIAPDVLEGGEMPYAIDQKKGALQLKDFTAKAIKLLDNPNGFFVMIEGGKIDWAAHNNDAATLIGELIAFDNAIKEALSFYKKHPKETTIIITADHETGGLAMGWEDMHYESNLSILKNQKGTMETYINLLEAKKDSLSFNEMLNFSQDFFGINVNLLNKNDSAILKADYLEFIKDLDQSKNTYAKHNALASDYLKILSHQAGVAWTTHSHTATPVPVRAIGNKSTLFSGFYENTEIPKKIAIIMGIKDFAK